MFASFWIDYVFPSESHFSSVPVNSWDGKTYGFEDGAYDVIEHTPEGFYPEWERIVCTIIAPKLARHDNGHAVSFNICGESWTFVRNDYRDDSGALIHTSEH